MAILLQALGGLLTLAGLCFAGLGVQSTREQYAPDRLGAWGTLRTTARTVRDSGMRLVRRQPPEQTAHLVAVDAVATAENAAIATSPDPNATQAQLMAYLVERVQCLERAVQASSASAAEQIKALDSNVAERVAEQGAKLDLAMSEGLTTESVGLALAALGTVLQSIGSLIAS
ncbi:hypothetical protein AB0D08_04900 [Kitasatospora sp. NPDC048540]|uniref:hypothetical protein n=1 Tax=Kitasatospora sp. NPDC048540 TaxID=3155634 RepID=UPI0033DBCBBD